MIPPAGTAGHPEKTAIGVFDSGFGGLTVLRALLPRLPGAHFLYLGDTARLPYGAKSQATVARYAVEAAHFLVAKGAPPPPWHCRRSARPFPCRSSA